MDVRDVKVIDEGGFLSRNIFQSKEHFYVRVNLDQSGGQKNCVFTFGIYTQALSSARNV